MRHICLIRHGGYVVPMLAVLITLVLWTHPSPTLWLCNPGHSPLSAPSNCEHVRYSVLAKLPVFGR